MFLYLRPFYWGNEGTKKSSVVSKQFIIQICCFIHQIECDGGSNRTDLSGSLHFMKGSKPQEKGCKWIIGDEGDPKGDHVIINTYVQRGAECG